MKPALSLIDQTLLAVHRKEKMSVGQLRMLVDYKYMEETKPRRGKIVWELTDEGRTRIQELSTPLDPEDT